MKKIITLGVLLIVNSNVFAIPTLTEASATGTTFKFATKLSEKLPTGYKVKIDLNNSKGLVAMTCSGLTCSLSSNALPKNTDSPNYKIGIYDAKGVLQGTTINGNYVIVSTVVTSAYTKISNSGAVLPDTATLGSGANDWACTKDNKTGLTWEVKTDDGGLRDKDWYYSWYKPSGDNGGFAGYTDINVGYGAPNCSTQNNCNTDAFTNAVNAKGLCGKKDWRMPTKDELEGLLTTTSTINQPINDNLFIDANYFPNTNSRYWSSSPYADFSGSAWVVLFSNGLSRSNFKIYGYFVRLVR